VRRLALILAATAAMIPMLAGAASASADPLPAFDVWVNSNGDVCVTYQYLTTVCTNL
jgi:hypothetical protein